MPSNICVEFKVHWINGWFIRALARPFMRSDGDEKPCGWKVQTVVEVPPGRHVIETFMRYKGLANDMGVGSTIVEVPIGQSVCVRASNGWMNQKPFRPVIVDGPASADAAA